jgi:hypothetical protein
MKLILLFFIFLLFGYFTGIISLSFFLFTFSHNINKNGKNINIDSICNLNEKTKRK